MYITTLSKHPHVNSNQLMITVYELHYSIKSRSMTCVSMFRSTMSNPVVPMTRDNLDTNIIAHYRNLIIMIHCDFLHTMLRTMDFINLIKDLNQFNV